MPMADPQLEFHWLPDPGFLIQGFLIHGPRRITEAQSKAVGKLQETSLESRTETIAQVAAKLGKATTHGSNRKTGPQDVKDFRRARKQAPTKEEGRELSLKLFRRVRHHARQRTDQHMDYLIEKGSA